MEFSHQCTLAEQVVQGVQRRLPEEVRLWAQKVPVLFHDWPSEEILGKEFEPDILGLFVGDPYGSAGEAGCAMPTQILLFLENIFDYAEGDQAVFCDEVKLTYLHELGHYFGWDEDEVAARGLD